MGGAKFFNAKWENERGWGYLAYLFGCERVVTEGIPKMIEEFKKVVASKDAHIKSLNDKLAASTRPAASKEINGASSTPSTAKKTSSARS